MTHEITIRGRRGGKVAQACGRCGRDFATIYNGHRVPYCAWSQEGEDDGAAVAADDGGDYVLLRGKVEIVNAEDAEHLPVWEGQ